MQNEETSRRAFLQKSCSVLTAIGLAAYGINAAGCDTTESSTDGVTISGSTMTIDLAVATALAATNGFLVVSSAHAIVINAAGTYRAFSNVCPHEGNPIREYNGSTITCTYHNWTFSSQGAATGVAKKSLTALPLTKNGNILTITI